MADLISMLLSGYIFFLVAVSTFVVVLFLTALYAVFVKDRKTARPKDWPKSGFEKRW